MRSRLRGTLKEIKSKLNLKKNENMKKRNLIKLIKQRKFLLSASLLALDERQSVRVSFQ